jgi:hypothetical protein
MQLKLVKQFSPQVKEIQFVDMDDEKITVTLVSANGEEMNLIEFIDEAVNMAEYIEDLPVDPDELTGGDDV